LLINGKKRWFDKNKAKEIFFEEGDLILKRDKANKSKGKHSKFQNLSLGPFQVYKKIGADTYRLQNMRGEPKTIPVNGEDLKTILLLKKKKLFKFLLAYISIRISV
jgi:hypothetical protein